MRVVLAAVFLCACWVDLAKADSFSGYGDQFRRIVMPPNGVGSFGLFGDSLLNGRIVAMTGRSIFVETGIATGTFTVAATFDNTVLAAGDAADPAFLRVSPDGTRLAIGLGFGKPIAIVPVTALSTGGPASPIGASSPGVKLFNVPHTEAAWRNNNQLALSAGSFGSPSRVTLLDTTSNPAAPSNQTIIANIGGASAGVVFDNTGRLYTGNGFDLGVAAGASVTGSIRVFAPSQWSSAAADFENSGTLIGKVLSASGLTFDAAGDLAVGGGDFGGNDFGYLGLISRSALADVLAGGSPIDRNDPSMVRRLTPDSDPFAFYGAAANPLTGELYATVTDFNTGGNTWYATIPAPSSATLALVGILTQRRRR